MRWEYFSKRRRVSLARFLKGVKTLAAAKLFFEARAVSPPKDGTLEALYSKPSPVVIPVVEKEDKPSHKKDHRSNRHGKDAKKSSKRDG